MRFVKAKLQWVSHEQGGRRELPSGPRYITVGRFSNSLEETDWSLIIELGEQLITHNMLIQVGLLSPEAPSQLLDKGNCFELLEGGHIVARGEVLEGKKGIAQ